MASVHVLLNSMIMQFVAILIATTGCIITVVACPHMYADLNAQPVRVFAHLVAYHRSHHHSGLTVMCLLIIRF